MDPSWTRAWAPGTSEQAADWVLRKLAAGPASARRFEGAALTQAIYACITAPGTPVTLTVAIADRRVRITGRPAADVGAVAARAWREQADRIADRHGDADDQAGLWAELDLRGAET